MNRFEKRLAEARKLMQKINENDFIYLAGLIDGEGTLTFKRYRTSGLRKRKSLLPLITVTNTDFDLINWVHLTFSLFWKSNVSVRGYRRQQVSVGAEGVKILALLEKLEPYLKVKKKHCQLLKEWIKLQLKKSIQAPYSERQIEIDSEIRKLNRRGIRMSELG